MTISEILLPEFDEEIASTRRMLESLPEDKFGWKPHEKSMTLAQLASHVGDLPSWMAMIITTEKLDFAASESIEGFQTGSHSTLMAHFNECAAGARNTIENTSDEQFAVTWTLAYGEKTLYAAPRRMAVRTIALNHLIHHRGQLSLYLRLLERKVPGMYGPSADEMDTFLS